MIEARTASRLDEALAGVGFVVLFTLPVLFVLSLVLRGVWLAWQPRSLAADLVAEDAGAPLLAGWLLVVWVGALALGFSTYATTRLLAETTDFRPMIVGFVQPVLGVIAGTVLVVCSRPAAHGLARLAAAIDRRWRARGRRTLLRPAAVIGVMVVLTCIALAAIWSWVDPQLGHLDLTPGLAPLVGLAVAFATHRLARDRAWMAYGLSLLAASGIVYALDTLRARPAVTLAVWGDMPVAGLLIDGMLDVDAIRDDVSLDAFRPVARADARHPDLVLITIDTVRADRTPPYGGPAAMPFFHKLATRGAVFEWAFAPSNVTRRSIPSMMTGLQPNRVRGRVVGWALRIDPRHVMLAERLRAGGYQTAGFMCCDGFWGDKVRTGLSRGLEHLEIDRNGSTLAARARAWVEAREERPDRRPLFLWMHVLEPHNWAIGGSEPADLVARRTMYDRALTASDRMLAELVGAFAGRAPEAAPIVIVTADHGEALGDHGEPNHSTDLYNSQIRVPFVVAGPGIRAGHLNEPVSLTDLTPTIVELGGFAPPVSDGRSLAPLLRGEREPDPALGIAYAAMIRDRSNPGGSRAFVVGTWKLLAIRGRFELYDLANDPHERVDLASSYPAKVDELRRLLDEREHLARSPFDE